MLCSKQASRPNGSGPAVIQLKPEAHGYFSGHAAGVAAGMLEWSDHRWPGIRIDGEVIYEMHIGTFTSEGTWQTAMPELEEPAVAARQSFEPEEIWKIPGPATIALVGESCKI